MNLYGQDMDDTQSPLESGLAWTVDLKSERDFIGKAARKARGEEVHRDVRLAQKDEGKGEEHAPHLRELRQVDGAEDGGGEGEGNGLGVVVVRIVEGGVGGGGEGNLISQGSAISP